MNTPTAKSSSPRAASGIVFACFSLFMWRIYGHVHWIIEHGLRARATAEPLILADKELIAAYLSLAALAVIWSIWSWMTESRLAATISLIFTALAVAVVSTMWIHTSP